MAFTIVVLSFVKLVTRQMKVQFNPGYRYLLTSAKASKKD
jgi:hypothetical protein